jgi:hypothetical protein
MFSMIVVVIPLHHLSVTFVHQHRNRRFTTLHFLLAHSGMAVLSIALCTLVFMAICYWWIGFEASGASFGISWLAIYLVCLCIDTLCSVIGFAVPSALVSSIVSATLVSSFAVFDGFYLPFTSMTRWMLFLSYLSRARYAYELMAYTALVGRTFVHKPEGTDAADRAVDGAFLFRTVVNDQPAFQITYDVCALVLYFALLRLVFFAVVHAKADSATKCGQHNTQGATESADASHGRADAGMGRKAARMRRWLLSSCLLGAAVGVCVLTYSAGPSLSSASSGALLLPTSMRPKRRSVIGAIVLQSEGAIQHSGLDLQCGVQTVQRAHVGGERTSIRCTRVDAGCGAATDAIVPPAPAGCPCSLPHAAARRSVVRRRPSAPVELHPSARPLRCRRLFF